MSSHDLNQRLRSVHLAGDCPSFVEVTPGPNGVRRTPAHLAADELPAPDIRQSEVRLRLAGVGGTGVVTVAQVLAVAGLISDRAVRGLDQTGLAQKGGAVLSDLRITNHAVDAPGRLASRECDLYLGADLLVAADPANLTVTDPDRTVAVVSTAQVPTGAMIVDPGVSFPHVDTMVRRITDSTHVGTYLDARGLAEQLFGDDQYANMILVGAAFQMGALPLPVTAIEEAISLNGVAVATNVQAFRRGRQVIADSVALDRSVNEAATIPTSAPDPLRVNVPVPALGAPDGSELARLVGIRVAELRAYQDDAYAARYVADVERVRVAEAAIMRGSSILAETVATHLFAIMAYKDEYEVARLCLDPALVTEVQQRFGTGSKLVWKLHPPVLRGLGMQRKIALGPWARPALRMLRAMRRVRGTRLDVFGLAHVRRVERALLTEYRAVIDELLATLSTDSHAAAVEIAELPGMVRGYEQIKLDSVERYHSELARLRAKLRPDPFDAPGGRSLSAPFLADLPVVTVECARAA